MGGPGSGLGARGPTLGRPVRRMGLAFLGRICYSRGMGDDDRVLDLCCGGKKCPVLREDHEGFCIEDAGQTVTFTREQAAEIAAWLARRLSAQ